MNSAYGDVLSLLNAPTKDSYRFLYWEGSRFDAGEEYTVTGAHTFKAVWEPVNEAAKPELVDETEEDKESLTSRAEGDKEFPTSNPSSHTAKHTTAKSPKTGDRTNNGIPFFIAAFAFLSAAIIVKRKNTNI